MSRLIDADALVDIVETARRKAKTLTGMDFVLVIKKQPTIGAIPVEWLEEQADYTRSEWDYDTCKGIRIVLKAWQKEQEAR